MDSGGMITATAWVPRGFAAQFPTRKEFDEEEFDRIAELSGRQLADAKEDMKDAEKDREDAKMDLDEDESTAEKKAKKTEKDESKPKKEVDDDDLREYNLDTYDDDDDVALQSDDGEPMGMFASMKSLAYHKPGEDDPYITLKDDDDDEEKEELQVLATDNLLLAARTEDEVAHLEVYVYEDSEDNLYVHHDIMLPAIPLCVEWLDIPVGVDTPVTADTRGNFAAIGTMDPDIEIWDLDVVDSMYPNAILGAGGDMEKKKKKKKKASKKANSTHHVDAVLTLAANRQHRNLLASGSADTTIKLWDLNTTKCAQSYQHHTDKVSALAWHPTESTVLLSGSWDRTVCASDMRVPDNSKLPRWGVESDVENVRWNPHDPNFMYITTEDGIVHYHDVRNAPSTPTQSKPVWTLQAHDKPCSAFDVNPIIPGFLATGSFDKTVKLWSVAPGGGPSLVVSRDIGVGKVFSAGFAPDGEVGFRLAVAGSNGKVQVWDTSTNAAVRRTFAERVPAAAPGTEVKERLVGVADSDDESDDDEEAVPGPEGAEEDSDEDEDDSDAEPDGWESMDEK